ncbi:hypothetical protein J437_LFUL013079 [Ladona fulva]|uniref:Glutaminyl-peptide cyclotransferase n=1 Tax=Ladona fulva TaxID=123851 RepID=A0A8K0KD87_LADFU|nr:hypothetical protein J437_LFUL013079 [Ladona fulva]
MRTAEKSQHKGLPVTDDLVRSISQYSNVKHFKDVLNSILIPRVVGTRNHEKVKEFLISSMEGLGWEVETDQFEDRTPLGKLKFENVVARLNPDARRYLVLACHYDSKYVREGSFLGATDSAVPCAMMVNLAYTLKDKLDEIRNQTSVSLKFIFFDGEEAFEEWGPLDSIYGARHLARKWERTPYPQNTRDGTNKLHQMDLLVLLDLLGAPNPSFYNFFSDTQKWYKRITAIEKKLRSLQLISDEKRPSLASHPPQYFHERSFYSGIEDDHIPFMEKGVPILHIIPYPFPAVWHTEDDNLSAVHFDTVENLSKIMRVFVMSYLKTKA